MLKRFWRYNGQILRRMSRIAVLFSVPIVATACVAALLAIGLGAAIKVFAIGVFFVTTMIATMAGILLMDHVRRM